MRIDDPSGGGGSTNRGSVVNADLQSDGAASEYSDESAYMHADTYFRDFYDDEDTYTFDEATGEKIKKKHAENFIEMLTDNEFFTVT